MPLEEVHNIRFSGHLKLWHRFVPAATGEAGDVFAARLLQQNLEGYCRWVERSAPCEEYGERGCRLPSSAFRRSHSLRLTNSWPLGHLISTMGSPLEA